jgi:tripartite-type tricarboxylate transporter receptor subunit TctC
LQSTPPQPYIPLMKYHFARPLRHSLPGLFLAASTLLTGATLACAEDWPIRPIKLLVPFAAGGNIDVTGRLMAARLSDVLGQQVVVENRVGGSGIIATEAVARAAPDGYTLLWASTNVLSIAPNTMPVPYDPQKDFAPISALGVSPQVLLISSKIPVQTLAEFVSYAKARPEPLAYGGGGGLGSASNLIMALFLERAGLKMTSVSYRGTAPALTDVIAGHIDVTCVPILEAHAQRSNPGIRILAVTSGARSPRMPDVPSIAETYAGFNGVSWTGMLAPAGTPKAIVEKLAVEMVRAANDPSFIERLRDNGIDPIAEGPEKFTAMIASDLTVWANAAKIAGIHVQQ